jgi:hypothetical protein
LVVGTFTRLHVLMRPTANQLDQTCAGPHSEKQQYDSDPNCEGSCIGCQQRDRSGHRYDDCAEVIRDEESLRGPLRRHGHQPDFLARHFRNLPRIILDSPAMNIAKYLHHSSTPSATHNPIPPHVTIVNTAVWTSAMFIGFTARVSWPGVSVPGLRDARPG